MNYSASTKFGGGRQITTFVRKFCDLNNISGNIPETVKHGQTVD